MTLADKSALVTGATGFVGGALALRLAAGGAHVKALARSTQKSEFLRDWANVQVIQGDLTNPGSMRHAASGCDYVFNIAAAMGGPLEHQRRANVEGVRNMMEAAAAAGVQRVVHISTIAVYGYAQQIDLSEDSPLTPGPDPYSISKAEGESMVRQVGQARSLSFAILRPGMIYGPRSKAWTGRMFKLARRRPVIFLGNGRGSVPAIFIDDLLDLCIVAARHEAAHNQASNAASDPAPTWREYLGAYSRLAGHQNWLGIPIWLAKGLTHLVAPFARPWSMLKYAPTMLEYADRYVNFKMDKARRLLGWEPRVDLQTGVHNCVPWLREQGLLA